MSYSHELLIINTKQDRKTNFFMVYIIHDLTNVGSICIVGICV